MVHLRLILLTAGWTTTREARRRGERRAACPPSRRPRPSYSCGQVVTLPTVIGHSLIAVTAAFGFRTEAHPWKFVLLSIACAAAPDADIAGYLWLYVPYDSFLGHRGFFHSPFFAALLSLVVVGTFSAGRRFRSEDGESLSTFFSDRQPRDPGCNDQRRTRDRAAVALQQPPLLSALEAARGFAHRPRGLPEPARHRSPEKRIRLDRTALSSGGSFSGNHEEKGWEPIPDSVSSGLRNPQEIGDILY